MKWWILLAAGVSVMLPAPASLVWRPGEGWVNESGKTLEATSSRAQLNLARQLEQKENFKEARAAYAALVRHWPLSRAAGEAQFKVGMMSEKMGDFWTAYNDYKKVVEKYPNSAFFDLAIERQYHIGNLYLAGEPQRIWKIPLLPSMPKAIEIYQSVIKSAPFGRWAPAAMFKIGLANEKMGNWSGAIKAYNDLLERYPNSEFADDAQYQIGYAWYQASSAADYDQSAANKSIEAFQDFLTRYPRSEKVTQATNYISELQDRSTEGSLNIAQFYEKQGNLKAAFIYYSEVVRLSPDSNHGRIAKDKMERLRPLVEKDLKSSPDDSQQSEQANGPGVAFSN